MKWRISTDGTTVVSTSHAYEPLETCPYNMSVWLLTMHGKAVEGRYYGQKGYVGWAAKPYIPDTIKGLIK